MTRKAIFVEPCGHETTRAKVPAARSAARLQLAHVAAQGRSKVVGA
jgi:hypothetical protein